MAQRTPPGQARMAADAVLRQLKTDNTNRLVPIPTRNAPPGIGAAESIGRAKAAKAAVVGTKPGKPAGGASDSPPPAAKAAAVASSAPSSAEIVAKYNEAMAGILGGMAPQVAGFYRDANQDLTKTVGGLSEDLRSRLFGAGTDTAGKLTANLGGIDTGQGVAEAYNPGKTADAAYALGAAFPGESLAKQGAAFGSAAAFAPLAAATQGGYELNAAIAAEQKLAMESGKVSAPLSKLMGVMVDQYGNPILGKDGKPLPLPEPQLTPYQKATLANAKTSLDIRKSEIDWKRYDSDRDYKLAVDKANDIHNRYYDGLEFQNAKAAKQFQLQEQKMGIEGSRIDRAASVTAGHIVLRDGSMPKDKKGHYYALATPTAKPNSPSANAKLDDTISLWKAGGKREQTGTKTSRSADGLRTITTPTYKRAQKPMNYQVALRKLRGQYHLSFQDAQDLLNTHYNRGEQGRPLVSFDEAKEFAKPKYVKWGITPALLHTARAGGAASTAIAAAHAIQSILEKHGISWANEPNV